MICVKSVFAVSTGAADDTALGTADETSEGAWEVTSDDDGRVLTVLLLASGGVTLLEHPAIIVKTKETIIIFKNNFLVRIDIAIFLFYICYCTKNIIIIVHSFHFWDHQ